MSMLGKVQGKLITNRSKAINYLAQRYSSTFFETKEKPQGLVKTSEELILKRPWATYPFDTKAELSMPIYNLQSGEFTGEAVKLDPKIFNNPLRRDIVHCMYDYERKFGWKTWKETLTRATTQGSTRKLAPQKGRGKARVGSSRAPQRRGGGKAHGKVPRDFTIEMNDKTKLLAYKTMLSALLFENRLVFIDTEELGSHKTRLFEKFLLGFNKNKLLFLHPMEPWLNFQRASSNIGYLKTNNPDKLKISDALNSDIVVVSKQALLELEMILEGRHDKLYRVERGPRPALPFDELLGTRIGKKPDFFQEALEDVEKYAIDPEKEVELYSQSLHGYLERAEEYEKERRKIQDSKDILWVNKTV